MLVLSRQRNQSVITSNGVKVTVVDIRGDKVRLGFEADPSVVIDREEIAAAKNCEQRNITNCRPRDVVEYERSKQK